MIARILSRSEYALWDQLLDDSEQATFYHRSAWLQICSSFPTISYRKKELKIFGCFEKEELVAGCAVIAFGSRFLRQAVSGEVGMSPYGGLVLRKPNTESVRKNEHRLVEIVQTLSDALRGSGLQRVRLINHPSLTDIRPFIQNGWVPCLEYSYHLDLPEMSEDRIARDARRAIKNATSSGIECARLNEFDIDCLHELFSMTWYRQRLAPPFGKDFIEAVFHHLGANNCGEMWVARSSGQAVASEVLIWDDRMVYRWAAASHTNFKHTGAVTLLLWKIFNDFSDRGYRTIDLWAAGEPGLAEFVASFNPRLVSSFAVDRRSDRIRIVTHLHKLVREFKPQLTSDKG